MCGFIGYILHSPLEIEENEEHHLEAMTNVISHRGPDDSGFFADHHVRFGFRRLSIIDLEHGRQPLSYDNERYFIVFNGEIYNYIELRKQLEKNGHTFQTDSDTEVILALYSEKGEKAVHELRGMFAFLIWDRQEKVLFGARDPFGIKPFFYIEHEQGLFCASEKKSLLINAQDEVNLESLHHYLTFQYVPGIETMSTNINELQPGHFLYKKADASIKIETYWKPSFQPKNDSFNEQIKILSHTLRDSVQKHMRSDVPVGAFLSGGVDSSAIVALAKEVNPNLKTFTVGFERNGFSEIDIAKDTAAQLSVDNFHYVITPDEFVQALPQVIWHMGDPVADPAAIPLYFVAREAKKQVKVVLSGEGADELFGGYNIYREPGDLKKISQLPPVVTNVLRSLSRQMPEGMKGKSFLERGTTPLEHRFIGNAKLYTEIEKENLLKYHNANTDFTKITQSLYDEVYDYSDVHKMQYIDLHTWLRGDILVKADRMTMAHSLELRVPFLDKEVFRIASEIGADKTIKNGTTKYALREAMRGIVPDDVLYNKKLGFPVPIRHWLKNELYVWAKNIIKTSKTDHLIQKSYVLEQLESHRKGTSDQSRKLWAVLVFMIWHQLYVEQSKIVNAEELYLDNFYDSVHIV